MRTETITRTVYTLAELKAHAPKAYAVALQNIAEWETDHDWWDTVYTDFQAVAAHCGWDIGTRRQSKELAIYFRGFWSQGDGAQFEGDWRAARVNVAALQDYAPLDERLHAIGARLVAVAAALPDAVASVRSSGHYSHSGCTAFDFDPGFEDYSQDTSAHEKELISASRALMDWLYSHLRAQYDYLQGEEHCVEYAADYGCEFYETGEML